MDSGHRFRGRSPQGECWFTLNGYGYVVLGEAYYDFGVISPTREVWRFNPIDQSWLQMQDFPGSARRRPFCFTIGDRAYLGSGSPENGFDMLVDLWEYDPNGDDWLQKQPLPFLGRQDASAFAIGGNGFVGLGLASNGSALPDFWMYQPDSDTWVERAAFPMNNPGNAFGFTLGNIGYVGEWQQFGFWAYSPFSNSWQQKATNAGNAVISPVAFVLNGRGYCSTGSDFGIWSATTYEYTPDADVGLAEGSIDHFSMIYPNPTTGQVQVLCDKSQPITRLMAFSPADQVVRDVQPTQSDRYTLDLSNEANGLYTVRVMQGNEPTQLRVMVQH